MAVQQPSSAPTPQAAMAQLASMAQGSRPPQPGTPGNVTSQLFAYYLHHVNWFEDHKKIWVECVVKFVSCIC